MSILILKPGELHIWQYKVEIKNYHSEKTDPILSFEEKEKYLRFINESDKVKYICNHVFLRKVLANYLNLSPKEIKFSYTTFGKPYIKNTNLFFNLSHRREYGLLAISKDNEVGVDIEYMKDLQDVDTFLDYSFSAEEKAMIFANNKLNKETLFTFWAFKEAFIKATGTGLSIDISKINLADFYNNETISFEYDNNAIWTLKRLHAEEGYKAAFAIKGKVDEVVRFDF